MITSQGSGGFHNTEAGLGGADAVSNTPSTPNPGSAGQNVRKGTVPDEVGRGRSTGHGASIGAAAFAVLLAAIVLVLLMLFAGLGTAPTR